MNSIQTFLTEIKGEWALFAQDRTWLKHLGRLFPAVIVFLISAAVALTAQITGWSGPKEGLLWLDMHATFWILLVIFAGLVSLLVYLWSDLVGHIKSHRPSLAYLLMVFAIAGFACYYAGGKIKNHQTGESVYRIEPMHRVQSDESIFLNVAQNMASRHIAATCEEALMDKGMECVPGAKGHTDVDHLKLKSMPVLLTVMMPLLGKNLAWIYSFQLGLLFLTLLLMGTALWLWTKEAFLSLIALALVAWAPLTLFQFRSFSVEPMYLFLGSIALICYHFALKSKTDRLVAKWALLALAIGFWLHTRQETFFTLPALFLFALPAMQRDSVRLAAVRDTKPKWQNWCFDPISLWSVLVAIALIPVYCLVVSYWGYDFQGGEFKPHGHFWENLRMLWQQMTLPHTRDIVPNVFVESWNQLVKEWLKVDEEALLTTPFLSTHAWLALLGIPSLLWMAYRDVKVLRWVVFILLFQFQTYMILENVSGDLGIEINQRYALIWLPLQALLGAAFLRVLFVDLLPLLFPKESGPQLSKSGFNLRKDSILLALIGVTILTALTWRHQKSFKENIMYNGNHLTNEEKMIHAWLRTQPKANRLFVYNRSLHFVAYGMSSLKLETWQSLSPSERDELQSRFAGEIYYVRGLDCAENQNNHGKAAGQDASDLCGIFEQSNGMDKVYEEMVLGTYPLVIAKLNNGAPKVASEVGFLGVRPLPTGGLEAGINAGNCPAGSTLFLTLNGKLIQQAPCNPGVNAFALPPETGNYLNLEVELRDLAGASIKMRGVSLNALPEITPLSMEPANIRQAWYKPALGSSVMGKPLKVNGVQYFFGWGTHADSHMEFNLGGQFKTFKSYVGLDDDELGGDGAKFRILGDGKVLWESAPLQHSMLDSLSIDVSGVQVLTLESDKLATDNYDHTDWLLPALYK